MQSCIDPDTSNSLQLSLDSSPSTPEFAGNFPVLNALKLEQHDSSHRFIGQRIEQLGAAFRHLGEDIRRDLFFIDPIDSQVAEPGLSEHASAASFQARGISLLG